MRFPRFKSFFVILFKKGATPRKQAEKIIKSVLQRAFFRFALLFPFRFLVLRNRLGKLVRAGSIVSATDSRKQLFHLVDVLAFHKPRDALQITAAAADKAHVVQRIIRRYVKQNLS